MRAGRGLTCIALQRCRYIYSPYYTSAAYGGCADYRTSSGASCPDWERPTNCTDVPISTTTCPLGGATATFRAIDCMCR